MTTPLAATAVATPFSATTEEGEEEEPLPGVPAVEEAEEEEEAGVADGVGGGIEVGRTEDAVKTDGITDGGGGGGGGPGPPEIAASGTRTRKPFVIYDQYL